MNSKIKLFFVIITISFAVHPVCAMAKTYFCLIDISGSISECQDGFRKNLMVINQLIDQLQRGDRFMAYAYRSSGSLVEVADGTMPERFGPRNRFMITGRKRIRNAVVKGLKKALKTAPGQGTDCIGALNQALLIISDTVHDEGEILLFHFSDGFQTTGVGSFKPAKYKSYLKRLEKKVKNTGLLPQEKVSRLLWLGATCNLNKKLTLNQAAYLKSAIRHIWVKFLQKNMPKTQIRYLIEYEGGKIF